MFHGARSPVWLCLLAAKRATDEFAAWLEAGAPRRTGPSGVGIDHYDRYLQQPSYGASYLVGRMQIEQLAGVRPSQFGEGFTIRRFMDELDACGMFPMPMMAWELTGAQPAALGLPRPGLQ